MNEYYLNKFKELSKVSFEPNKINVTFFVSEINGIIDTKLELLIYLAQLFAKQNVGIDIVFNDYEQLKIKQFNIIHFWDILPPLDIIKNLKKYENICLATFFYDIPNAKEQLKEFKKIFVLFRKEEEIKKLPSDLNVKRVKLTYPLEPSLDFWNTYHLNDFILCLGDFNHETGQLEILKALSDITLPCAFVGTGYSNDEHYLLDCSFYKDMYSFFFHNISNKLIKSAIYNARALLVNDVNINNVFFMQNALFLNKPVFCIKEPFYTSIFKHSITYYSLQDIRGFQQKLLALRNVSEIFPVQDYEANILLYFQQHIEFQETIEVHNVIVSVIIPVANRKEYLKDTIVSVLMQSFRFYEILIVVDGIFPEIQEILEEFKHFQKVRIIELPSNSGNACIPRNKGIEMAKGRYVAFLDSDDLMDKDRLLWSVEAIADVDFVFGHYRIISQENTEEVKCLPVTLQDMLKCNHINCSTVMIKKEILLKYGIFNPSMKYCEDYELWLRLLHHGAKFKLIDKIINNYRIHDKNLEKQFLPAKTYWINRAKEIYSKRYYKILFIITEKYGSKPLATNEYAELLKDRGHDVDILIENSNDYVLRSKVDLITEQSQDYNIIIATDLKTARNALNITGVKYYLLFDQEELEPEILQSFTFLATTKNLQFWLQDKYKIEAFYLPIVVDKNKYQILNLPSGYKFKILLDMRNDSEIDNFSKIFSVIQAVEETQVICLTHKEIKSANLPTKVSIIENPSLDDLSALYSSCGCIVKHATEESSIISYMEPMLFGCPVIALDYNNIKEVCMPEYNYLNVNPKFIKQTKKYIKALMMQKEESARLKFNAQIVSDALFESAPKINKLEQILRKEIKIKIHKSLKILYVLPSLFCCGGIRIVFEHANRLKAMGHEVHIATESGDLQQEWFPGLNVNIKTLKQIDNDYTLVVATAWHTVYTVQRLNLSATKVYLVQNREQYFSANMEDQIRAEKTYSFSEFKKIVISKHLQDWLKNDYNQNSLYVRNGLNPDMFYPEPKIKKKTNKTVVLTEGSLLSQIKKAHLAFEAVKGLDVELWYLTSDSPKDDVDQLWVQPSQDTVRQVMSSADIMLKTSDIEGSPLPHMESLACGTTLLTTAATGVEEYCIHNHNSYIVPINDVKAIRSGLEKLLASKKLREKLANNGLETVKRFFGWDDKMSLLEKYLIFIAEDYV